MKPRIAILSFSDIARDGRVLRQIQSLSQEYDVIAIGYGHHPGIEHVKMYSIDRPAIPAHLNIWKKFILRLRSGQVLPYLYLILGRTFPTKAYEAWYWQRSEVQHAYQFLYPCKADFIHANDWLTLEVATRVAKRMGARVVADFHEYAPLESEKRIWKYLMRPLREYFIRKTLPNISASITVNQTIAHKYKQEFGIEPIVVMNTPKQDSSIRFKATNPEKIHLIHHGGAIPERQLEKMIQTIAITDKRYHLNFMLVGNLSYITRLIDMADKLAPGRVTFLPAVMPDEVTKRISKFDIGFHLLKPTSFNNAAAAPNKFFDFIHAGLAVCIGPSPEMKRLVDQYGFGVVAQSFEPHAVADTLGRLTIQQIDEMKRISLQVRLELNADIESKKMLSLYRDLLQDNS